MFFFRTLPHSGQNTNHAHPSLRPNILSCTTTRRTNFKFSNIFKHFLPKIFFFSKNVMYTSIHVLCKFESNQVIRKGQRRRPNSVNIPPPSRHIFGWTFYFKNTPTPRTISGTALTKIQKNLRSNPKSSLDASQVWFSFKCYLFIDDYTHT